ncbi:Chloroperoxidase [Xylogone sp. PMI_703]|nr:Chloroperoxidase [Xylogone sp. PMI_703]
MQAHRVTLLTLIVRGPCPGLNSLANHDICPRSGKNYTLDVLLNCMGPGLGMGADFITTIGTTALAANPENPQTTTGPPPADAFFNLDQLDEHNFPIEHDCSLSREDFFVSGDDHTFVNNIWASVLNVFSGRTPVTLETAAAARNLRVQQEFAKDPQISFTDSQQTVSKGETCLYLKTMVNPGTQDTNLEFVKVIFEEERLPFGEGWVPPSTRVTFDVLTECINDLGAFDPDTLQRLSTKPKLTVEEVRRAFAGEDILTGEPIPPPAGN